MKEYALETASCAVFKEKGNARLPDEAAMKRADILMLEIPIVQSIQAGINTCIIILLSIAAS